MLEATLKKRRKDKKNIITMDVIRKKRIQAEMEEKMEMNKNHYEGASLYSFSLYSYDS